MSQSLRNNETLTSAMVKQETQSTGTTLTENNDTDANERALDFLLNPDPQLDIDSRSPLGVSEPQHIDIMDDSPSPMASANSFLSHLSTNPSFAFSPKATYPSSSFDLT